MIKPNNKPIKLGLEKLRIGTLYDARRETGETQSHLRKMGGKKYITSGKSDR